MSVACCTATTRAGRPCAARPLPGSDYCLFHDPAHHQALAESRSKGGATPRRRTRRYPRLLDYKHVAELLSELLIDALNDPTAADPQRLRALTGLATVLLRAVGRPRHTYEIHTDRTEPDALEDHLLRFYPPEPPALTRLRAAEAQIEATLAAPALTPSGQSDPSDPSHPSHPSDPPPVPQLPTPNSQLPPPTPEPDYDDVSAEFERRFRTPPDDVAARRAAYYASPDSVVREPDWTRPDPDTESPWQQKDEQEPNTAGTDASRTDRFSSDSASQLTGSTADPVDSPLQRGSFPVDPGFSPGPGQQEAEQDPNRPGTGAPATDPFSLGTPAARSREANPKTNASLQRDARSTAPDASTATPSSPDSVSPCLRVEERSSTDTLSVPHVPILISLRRIPGPFE